MARTAEARHLTEQHRAAQVAIKTRLTADVLAAWSMLDMRSLDATTPGWLAVMLALIGVHRTESARTAAGYYTAHRAAELGGDPDGDTPAPDLTAHGQPDRGRVTVSLIVTGPATIKRASAKGRTLGSASRTAQARVTGAATRHALGGGRATITASIASDPKALGYVRVTDGDPCWFCAMLASRPHIKDKPVLYASARSAKFDQDGEKYHDFCACEPEPVYDLSAPLPGRGAEYAALWEKVTKDLFGNDARAAFRDAIDGMRTGERTLTSAPNVRPRTLPAPQDLTGLSDDDLAERFADTSAADEIDEAELDRILAEMDRRDAPPVDDDPLEGLDLETLPTFALIELWREHELHASVAERIGAELDRRASGGEIDGTPEPGTAPDDSPEAAETLAALDEALEKLAAQNERETRVDALIGRGYDYAEAYAEVYQLDEAEMRRSELAAALDAQRRTGETRDQTARRLYDEWVYLQWTAAENTTNGYLLSAAGRAARVDPRELWGGSVTRARKYASEELKRWWELHPRKTFTEFKAEVLGRDRDIEAAQRGKGRGNDKDFGL